MTSAYQQFFQVKQNPKTSGLKAPIGSIAKDIYQSTIYKKIGNLDTDWEIVTEALVLDGFSNLSLKSSTGTAWIRYNATSDKVEISKDTQDWQEVGTGGGGGGETLAATYALGVNAASQTMIVTADKGGGIVIDATSPSMVGATALTINRNPNFPPGGANDLALALSNYTGEMLRFQTHAALQDGWFSWFVKDTLGAAHNAGQFGAWVKNGEGSYERSGLFLNSAAELRLYTNSFGGGAELSFTDPNNKFSLGNAILQGGITVNSDPYLSLNNNTTTRLGSDNFPPRYHPAIGVKVSRSVNNVASDYSWRPIFIDTCKLTLTGTGNTLPNQVAAVYINAPEIIGDNVGTWTTVDAATVYIDGPPSAYFGNTFAGRPSALVARGDVSVRQGALVLQSGASLPVALGSTGAIRYNQNTGKLQVSENTDPWKDLIGGAGTDTNAVHVNTANEIAVITEKTDVWSGDWMLIEDLDDSNNKKKIQLGNIPPIAPRVISQTIFTDLLDFSPSGWNFAEIVRLSSNAAYNITGVDASAMQTIKHLINVGSFALTIKHEDAASASANRFLNYTGADIVLQPNTSLTIFIDSATGKVRGGI